MLNMNEINGMAVAMDNEIKVNGVVIGKVSDEDARKLITIINAMASGSAVPTTSTSKKSTKKASPKKSRLDAKDVDVTLKRTKNIVTLDGYVGKDTFGVLRSAVERNSGKYDKGTGFVFSNTTINGKKYTGIQLATEFVKRYSKVTGADRNNFRQTEWGWA